MGGLEGTIALLALIGLGVWLFGSFALRVGGLLLCFLGLFGLLTNTPQALVLVPLGAVAWVVGHWLYRLKHGVHKSPLAARILGRTPLDRGEPPYEDAWEVDDGVGDVDDRVWEVDDRVGELDEPCFETGKVTYVDEDAAWEAVESNQDRYDRGAVDYRLDRAYLCELCNGWHATSQAKRGF